MTIARLFHSLMQGTKLEGNDSNELGKKDSRIASSRQSQASLEHDGVVSRPPLPPGMMILACSARPTTSSSSSSSSSSPPLPSSLQELQDKLLGFASESTSEDNNDKLVVLKNPDKKNNTNDTKNSRDDIADGPLCQYQKGYVDHLKPKPLVTGTLRVAIQQGAIILTGFMTEQFEGELRRNKLVSEGKITQRDAEEEAEEWEKVEWEKRWKTFPSKFLIALAKFHAVTLVLRTYEYIASLCCSKETLDKLTMDPVAASRTMANKVDISNNKSYVFWQMADTTFWASLLINLADYSVHQMIFCYGYYLYCKCQKKLAKKETDKDRDKKAMAKSLVDKSSHLLASRSCGLVCSAIGAGIGTIVWPGYGTLFAYSMGDSAGAMLIDDRTAGATEALFSSRKGVDGSPGTALSSQ